MDRDDLKVITFAHPWKKPGYQVVKPEQLQCKGQVSEVTQYRHFENPPKTDEGNLVDPFGICLLYTSPSPRDATLSRMPSSA